jgi:hypothetical protein
MGVDRSIMTNRALRAKQDRPKLSDTGKEHDVLCPRCGGLCIPEELTVTKEGENQLYRHRVDVLMRCAKCATGQFLIIMPIAERVPLDLFTDVLTGPDEEGLVYVEVSSYGSEGCEPVHANECRLVKEDPICQGSTSCVSGSGGSICGYYAGYAGKAGVWCRG